MTDAAFKPIRILEAELSRPLAPIMPVVGAAYGTVNVLVRLHRCPIGQVHAPLVDGALSADALATAIWTAHGDAINAHLSADGLPTIDRLSTNGIAASPDAPPPCERRVTDALRDAPFIAIIIPTHNRADKLPVCVDSILAQRHSGFEIIIVDDAPSDDSTLKLYQTRYSMHANVHYVREHRPNAAWARNRGLEVATAPLVAFVDDDVRLDAEWLGETLAAFRAGPDVVCVTTLLLPAEIETQAQYWFEQYGGFNKGFTPRLYDLGPNRPESPLFPYTAGLFGTGGGVAFRTDWLRHAGGWDPDLPAGEDLSVFFEAVMSGHQLAYAPGAIGWHQHRRDYEQLRRQIYSYGWGLSAFVTRTITRDPRRLPGLIWRLPRGLAYMFSGGSRKNQRKQADYPAELTTLERRGLILGPWKYIRQRWQNRTLHGQPPLPGYDEPRARPVS